NREVVVRLTPKGAAILARVIPHAIALERTAIAGVPAKDLGVVRRSLRRMYQNLASSAGISERTAAPASRGSAASAASSRRRRKGGRPRCGCGRPPPLPGGPSPPPRWPCRGCREPPGAYRGRRETRHAAPLP